MNEKLYKPNQEERARIKDLLKTQLAQYPEIAFAYLYGSFIEDRPFHDVDVGIFLVPSSLSNTTIDRLVLPQNLSEQLNLPVDVRVLNEAPVSFLFYVFKGQLLLSRDEELRTSLMEDTMHRYFDIAPLLRYYAKEAFTG